MKNTVESLSSTEAQQNNLTEFGIGGLEAQQKNLTEFEIGGPEAQQKNLTEFEIGGPEAQQKNLTEFENTINLNELPLMYSLGEDKLTEIFLIGKRTLRFICSESE